MGTLLTAILQGAGRAGNEAAGAKQLRLDEQARKLELLKQQLGLSEVKQKLAMNAAPQFVESHTDPTGRRINTTRDPLKGTLTDQPGGQEQPKESWTPVLDEGGNFVAFDKTTGKSRPLELNGQQVKGVPKGKTGPLTIDGKPVGVWRGGKPITPDSPEWLDSDAVQLARYLKGYTEAESNKDKRIKLASESRVAAYMRTRMYGVLDAATGSLVMVNPDQMQKDPGRYAPAGPAIQAKNRAGIFNEIDVAANLTNDSIAKLPDDAFAPAARLQIAAALRSSNPNSTWHEFLTSDVAATLTPQQIDYVTSLVNLQESALALRSVAGLGQGSDKLRDAITKMLPGASTPSKAYAIRQMQLFKTEVNALRTTVPNIGEPGRGGGSTQTGQAETKDYKGHTYTRTAPGQPWTLVVK